MKEIEKTDKLLRSTLIMGGSLLSSKMVKNVVSFFKPEESEFPKTWVEITRNPLTLQRLGQNFHNFRVIQISDFHIGTWSTYEILMDAIKKVNQLSPDVVVITGDFVTEKPELFETDLVNILSSITANHGVLAVMGNHDHWADPILVRRVLKNSGVLELKNQVFTITRGEEQLHIAGVDDYMEEFDDLDQVLTDLPPSGSSILLVHEPDYALISHKSGRFDLQLSGHTHGGQVRLPWIGPLILPRLGKRYPCGLNRLDGMYIYTNRGLGTAEMTIRYKCPPEISLFILQSPDLSIQAIDSQ